MPPVAKENSEEGAEAFARWYVETLNHLYQHPQTGILDQYAGDNCKGCATQLRVMDRSVRNGEVAQGDVYSILGSSVLMTGDSRYEAVVAFRQHPVVFIDSQGKQVDKMKAQEEFGLRFELQYDDEWRVEAQFSNKSPQYEADPQ
ncbi:hypothetical protein BJF82_11495 [Kytococcus sp. CUA-901]|nr:hypothetical protein BJF82_11495 [Kytococcus sp. CUA-901]